ncbi:uncharacterized protein PV07_12514 [Cladophialophora immunda]|uniref:Gfo/Idh/MocA-like oxidoreductase C-terminal domain-containing protein n=1 Tax=Cladophialophora immunda TaxID=569365 RepID=A0A0D2BSS5_9EURO|nr:uncharacterized protein PV07_12514 [Cladophialophora immunda]KIW22098.1 hypothetical protein PV07_12514 [Cladophialophora immunda]
MSTKSSATFGAYSVISGIVYFVLQAEERGSWRRCLVDAGIYVLSWGLLVLDSQIGTSAENPTLLAVQNLSDGGDTSTSVLVQYPSTGQERVLTSTTEFRTSMAFVRIEGTKGSIFMKGLSASMPKECIIFSGPERVSLHDSITGQLPLGEVHQFEEQGLGPHHEADHVAVEMAAGKKESSIIPQAETIRVTEMLDEIRKQRGLRYPQDK